MARASSRKPTAKAAATRKEVARKAKAAGRIAQLARVAAASQHYAPAAAFLSSTGAVVATRPSQFVPTGTLSGTAPEAPFGGSADKPACASQNITNDDFCHAPPKRGVSYQTLSYRSTGQRQPIQDLPPPQDLNLACVPVRARQYAVGLDYRFDQYWFTESVLIGDEADRLSLAPNETLTITTRVTQRTTLSQNVVDSHEVTDSFESTVQDKDVLNLASSTSQTLSWRVDAHANFLVPGLSGGVSSGASGTVQDTANRTIERISDATRKSSEQLRTLHKVEISRTAETVSDQNQSRTISNPYKDRTLSIRAYEMLKCYRVRTRLRELRPVILLRIDDLKFDDDFIFANSDFLARELLDRSLANELLNALETLRSSLSLDSVGRARDLAAEAFRYLFDVQNVFQFNDATDDPSVSFGGSDYGDSGFSDCIGNDFAREIASLGTYYRLYRDLANRFPDEAVRKQLLVDLALSLSRYLSARIEGKEKGDIQAVFDETDRTDVMRRVPGFVSLVEGMLRPLVEPAERERDRIDEAGRAAVVLERLLKHLRCHRHVYIARYLFYLFRSSGIQSLVELFMDGNERTALLDQLVAMGNAPDPAAHRAELSRALESFDPYQGFLDGHTFVIPAAEPVTAAEAVALLEAMRGNEGAVEEPVFEERQFGVLLPTSGYHLEAHAGMCELADVPDQSRVSTNVSVEATSLGP